MAQKYATMTDFELKQEIERIQNLLIINKNPHTQKQNKKYLLKLYLKRKKRLNEGRSRT